MRGITRKQQAILIHTSVKLVTKMQLEDSIRDEILIHTSVKLVTHWQRLHRRRFDHFNPHEREARDAATRRGSYLIFYFNPHEREARDTFDADKYYIDTGF